MPQAQITLGRRLSPAIFVPTDGYGAGKSALGGTFIRGGEQNYFKPDNAARRISQSQTEKT
jgi:hypothetical protein